MLEFCSADIRAPFAYHLHTSAYNAHSTWSCMEAWIRGMGSC